MSDLLSILKGFKDPAIILALLIIWELVKKAPIMERVRLRFNNPSPVLNQVIMANQKLDLIKGNHLHDLPSIKEAIDRIDSRTEETIRLLTSIEAKMK